MLVTWNQIWIATLQTLQMVSISLLIGALIGIPLGILLVITNGTGIIKSKLVSAIINMIINIVRSIPFIILLVAIVPITRVIVGTSIRTKAAIVPLYFI